MDRIGPSATGIKFQDTQEIACCQSTRCPPDRRRMKPPDHGRPLALAKGAPSAATLARGSACVTSSIGVACRAPPHHAGRHKPDWTIVQAAGRRPRQPEATRRRRSRDAWPAGRYADALRTRLMVRVLHHEDNPMRWLGIPRDDRSTFGCPVGCREASFDTFAHCLKARRCRDRARRRCLGARSLIF
ncbi:hypothetical protein SAMN07250955_11374 [Arboricoccus pini]|uniref:Uncharacterized protein n=1 Tax=Arboricoccus pini TaxID=1963835 RepID=A0A212RSE5_9PROT|nr:hypothetical protein SAMN07250955_11374 [Arboricoccus pini]